MSYLPQDTTRLTRRGADEAMVSDALAEASSEIMQAIRASGRYEVDPPSTLAGFRGDARQVERYLLDLAAERIYEAQIPDLLLTEVITEGEVDHLLVDPDVLAEELRVKDHRLETWMQLAQSVSLGIAALADMPDGLGLLEVRQTLSARGARLNLPRHPVAEMVSVEVDGVEVTDYTRPEPDSLHRADGWGEEVVVHYRAGLDVPRSAAPMAWRAEASAQIRRAWTVISAGGFRPSMISPTGFQFDHGQFDHGDQEEEETALLRRLSLDRNPLDTAAREWLEDIRTGRRILDLARPAPAAARFVPRRRASWTLRLHGRSEQ